MRAARHARRRAARRRLPVGAARRARTAEPPDTGHDRPGAAADAGLPAVRELP
ncbi:hypothetical protein AB0N31_26745 [Streptomyces sp. NPDC051051]|uniref:hypothetical protein n=1 Tax=Streptomyces sp. NPDC051051 TaxID=3155666 RepID=UPI00342A3150